MSGVLTGETLVHHVLIGAIQQLDIALNILLFLVVKKIFNIKAELSRGGVLSELSGCSDVSYVKMLWSLVKCYRPRT